jgi:hypothetical protein
MEPNFVSAVVLLLPMGLILAARAVELMLRRTKQFVAGF